MKKSHLLLVALLVFPSTSPLFAQTAAQRSHARQLEAIPVGGLVETTWDDPDWILAASDHILPRSQTTRFWKFDSGVTQASVCPIAPLGEGTLASLYVRSGINFSLLPDCSTAVTPTPLKGPQYVSLGPEELGSYGIKLGGIDVAIEGGVRIRAALPSGLPDVSEVQVGPSGGAGVPVQHVREYREGSRDVIYYTPPPLSCLRAPAARGVYEVFIDAAGGRRIILGSLNYTEDPSDGMRATRIGVETAIEELLLHRSSEFLSGGREVAAQAEAILHGILGRAKTDFDTSEERGAVLGELEAFLPAVRRSLQDVMSGNNYNSVSSTLVRSIPGGQILTAGGCPPQIYVDRAATGANNGSSWGNAFTNLQTAMDFASMCSAGTPIWVKRGTYLPTKRSHPGDPRSVSFMLPKGVEVYGGFAGGETSVGQRNPMANPTTLSGDLAGNDHLGNFGDNAYQVVRIASGDPDTALDGLVVRGGYADGQAFPQARGAGIYISAGNPRIVGCFITANTASERGGGVFGEPGSSPTIDGCMVSGNEAIKGGGLYLDGGTPLIKNCLIRSNTGDTSAGGIWLGSQSRAQVIDCTFKHNEAEELGGGIHVADQSTPTFTRCRIIANSSEYGAMSCKASTITLRNCTFSSNASTDIAGALWAYAGSDVNLDDCVFIGNSSIQTGALGGLASDFSATGCLFQNNSASANIGVLELKDNSTATLSDCDFVNNSASSSGAIAVDNSTAILSNCSFRNNDVVNGGGAITLSQGDADLTSCSFTNNSAEVGGALLAVDSDLAMNQCSILDNAADFGGGVVCKNTSASLVACTFDSNGMNCILGGAIRLMAGTDASLKNCIFRTNRANQAGAIAIDASVCSVTVCLFERNSANGNIGALQISGGSTATLSGCDFTGNSARNSGAVIVDNSTATLTSCDFQDNAATLNGGALTLLQGNANLVDCNFTSNSANGGGAILLSDSATNTSFSGCNLAANTAATGGAALVMGISAPTFESCLFMSNTASAWGGGISLHGSRQTTVRNCMFVGNSAGSQGGGIRKQLLSGLLLQGSTLGGNSAAGQGGGIFLDGFATIRNSLLWGNSDGGGLIQSAQIFVLGGTTGFIHYSSIQGWIGNLGGTNNNGTNPLFVNPTQGDYHINLNSPARDSGDPNYQPKVGETDLDGEARVGRGIIDRGADEAYDTNGNGIPDYLEVLSITTT